MATTGIVRKIDELGRIVLPIELRRKIGLKERDSVEILIEGDDIILRKYQIACIFCGSNENISDFKGKPVCASCLSNLPH